jgi:hypothetical protein
VRRRQLLANLAATAAAAAAAGSSLLGSGAAQQGHAALGDLLADRIRDAMLGLDTAPTPLPADRLHAELAGALTDFHACRYGRLTTRLPRLITAGHVLAADADDPDHHALLAEVYLLATRVLIKLDDQQLGWMTADRARALAASSGDALTTAEASRNLAVLARKAGWYAQATVIALTAADDPALHGGNPAFTAERGLLIQSAAYTAARSGDRHGMRELTDEAAAIAAQLNDGTLLRNRGGGFTPATVHLHRISAENAVGEPGAAVDAARTLPPQRLPTVERRARYYTDLATAFAVGPPRRLHPRPARRRTPRPRGDPRPPGHPSPGLRTASDRTHHPRTARIRRTLRDPVEGTPTRNASPAQPRWSSRQKIRPTGCSRSSEVRPVASASASYLGDQEIGEFFRGVGVELVVAVTGDQ